MIYYVVIVLAGIIFSSLLIYFRKYFFTALEATLGLSDAVLSNEEELTKQKKLIEALKIMLSSLGISIGLIVVILVLTCLPVYIFKLTLNLSVDQLDLGSVWFIVSLSIGSIIPFLFNRKKSTEDYSEASILLHKLILDNYNLSKFLFSFDNKFKKGKKIANKETFLIVSGLARAGTTSLTDQLFKAGGFSSLDYSNMPLLLAPNLWKKMYNPKKAVLKERKHGDKMLFGFNTIEALEEYFFKVFLNDAYISDNYLLKHDITDEVYENYLKYQALIRSDNSSIYLAKNNNLILRYESLRKFNKDFKAIFLFRKPEEHAYSLLNQHRRFSEFQNESDFIQTYLNWLGHHEFGKNQKVFKFDQEIPNIPYDKNSLDYWLYIWLNYYNYLRQVTDTNYMLIEYEDYLNKPQEVLQYIEQEMGVPFDYSGIVPFSNNRQVDMSTCDPELLSATDAIYKSLQERKLKF